MHWQQSNNANRSLQFRTEESLKFINSRIREREQSPKKENDEQNIRSKEIKRYKCW